MPTSLLRVLVFDLPPLLDELVRRSLDATNDIESVPAARHALERAVAEDRPDAVIVPLDAGSLTAEGRRFLEDRARRPRVLGLGVRDGRAVLFELRPHRQELGEVVPTDLPELIRNALIPEPTT